MYLFLIKIIILFLLSIIKFIKFCYFLIKNFKINISYKNYNDNMGFEKLNIEFKQFTLNSCGLPFDQIELENYCKTNTIIPNFNNYIMNNLKIYINFFLIKNVCGFLNSNIKGDFYIGIDDFGNIKGIPYLGLFPLYYLYIYIYFISYYTTNSNIYEKFNINFIKIIVNKLNNKHPNINKYLRKKKKYYEELGNYNKAIEDWNKKRAKFYQKLYILGNLYRKEIIKFIQQEDFNNPIIKIFKSKYFFEDKIFIEINNKNNPYYWIGKWKDYKLSIMQKIKPQKSIKLVKSTFYKYKSIPLYLISTFELLPYWISKYNIETYVIHISIKKNNDNSKYINNNIFHERCITSQEEPYIKNTLYEQNNNFFNNNKN